MHAPPKQQGRLPLTSLHLTPSSTPPPLQVYAGDSPHLAWLLVAVRRDARPEARHQAALCRGHVMRGTGLLPLAESGEEEGGRGQGPLLLG